MTALNRLNFLQQRNTPIVFERERKERNLNSVSLQRVVVAVSSTFDPLHKPLGSKLRSVVSDPRKHFVS